MPAFSVSASRRQSLPTIADRPFEELKGLLRKSDVVVSDENIPPYKPPSFAATVPSSPTRATMTESSLPTPKAHIPPPLVLQATSVLSRSGTPELERKRSVPLLNRPIPKSFYEGKRPEGSSVFASTPAIPAPIIAITPAPVGSSVIALPALLPPKPAFHNAGGIRSFNSLEQLDRLEEVSEEGHLEPTAALPRIVTTSSSTEFVSTVDTPAQSPSAPSPSSRAASPSPTSPSTTSLSSSSTPTPSPTSSKRKSMIQSVLRPIKSATDIISLAKNNQETPASTPSSGTSTPRSSTPTLTIRPSTPAPSAVAQALSSAVRTVSSVAQVSSPVSTRRPTTATKTASKKERSHTLRPSTSDGSLNGGTNGQMFKWAKRASWISVSGMKTEPSD